MSVFWSWLKKRGSPLSSITPIRYSFSNFAESSINKILSFSNCSTLLFKSIITFDFRSICLFSSWDSNDYLFSSNESCFLFLGLCSNALNLPLSLTTVRLVDNTRKRFWSFEHLRELRGNFNFKLLLHNQFLVIFFNSVHYELFEIQRNELTIDVDLLTLPRFQSHVLSGTFSSDLNSNKYSSIGILLLANLRMSLTLSFSKWGTWMIFKELFLMYYRH